MDEQKQEFLKGANAMFQLHEIVDEEKTGEFMKGMYAELAYAHAKHPGWPVADAGRASAILTEEAGKLTQASIDYTYGRKSQSMARERMKAQALRVAAMAYRFYTGLPGYKYNAVEGGNDIQGPASFPEFVIACMRQKP